MEKQQMTGRCPICDKPRGAIGENRFFPFCSDRCRMVDLGRWLGGEYFIPDEAAIPDEDTEAE